MYSYSSAQRGGYQSQRRKRLTQAAFLILVIAIIVMVIVLSSAVAFRTAYQSSSIRLLDYEVDSALSQLNNLSRTGGSTTTSVLARIRQHVYAAQVLVDQNAELTSKHLLNPDVFTDLLTTLDNFESKKQSGQPTIEQQTALITSLQGLTTSIENLK